MEAKINIAEILKDKPQGTKLHDLLRNIDVKLDKVHTTDVGTYIDTTLDGYPIATYSNDELKILKRLLTKVLGEVNEYIHL